MPDINIKFHAAPDELSEWVREWAELDDIHLVAMLFPPVSFKEVSPDDVPEAIGDPAVGRISFILRPFDLSIKYQGDFDDTYSNQLILQVGNLSPDGLGESWLACRTDDTVALKVWKKIAKELKHRTNAGVTAVDRQTGGSGSFYRSHRYSEGAKKLESNGVEILSIVGPGKGPKLRLGKIGDAPDADIDE